jgi:protein phosphatase
MGSNSPKPGGLLARLFGVKTAENKDQKDQREEPIPVAGAPATSPMPVGNDVPAEETPLPAAEAVPVAAPVGEAVPLAALVAEPIPSASPVPEPVVPLAAPVEPLPVALATPVVEAPPSKKEEAPASALEPAAELEIEPEAAAPVVEAPPELCPICNAPRRGTQSYCDDCGWMFPPGSAARAVSATGNPKAPTSRLKDRFELGEMIGERGTVSRHRGWDHGSGNGQPVAVTILRTPALASAEILPAAEEDVPLAEESGDDLEILPDFDQLLPTATPVAETAASSPPWPSIAWESHVIDEAQSPALPGIIDTFVAGDYQYLVEEAPAGRLLWDAWDDPEATSAQRYGLLKQVAEAAYQVHQAGAVFECLRPDLIVVNPSGQVQFTNLGDLLPLPLPADLSVRVSLYTPPELVLSPTQVDGRANLYSIGAMLYALEYLHHELSESDFERQFSPKLITDRCPDVHPAFFRLISKTFVRDPNTRFPTDEASKEDATGLTELMRTLDVCGRAFDNVRLDIAAWTTTGMVRTGNEDAFAILHAVESRQDDLSEYALLLLADGMGGYEAGEVAAAMAIQALRKNLLQQKMFAALAGDSPTAADPFNVEECQKLLQTALKHANREVFTASRTPGVGKRGMGCTAEAVYVDAQNVVVGHVGDSRTYHLHEGRLVQLTRDQTFVNRMVELGKLTPEEAETHPRKNELQQAIGGQPDVVPNLYQGKLKRGDWVLVCSDGLSNHIPPEDLQKMLLREATSAEEAARRLLNLVNLRGATDNATVVIIRAC